MPLDGYAESKPLGTGTLSQPAEMNRGGAVRVPEETVEAPPAQEREGATKELRSRALSAVAMVAGRNVAIKIVALAGNVVFARLLAPSAMGTVAFGLTMLMLVQLLSDGGLGVGLIRRPEEPALEDLRVLLGYQLALTLLLACVIAAVSAPLGRVGEITAVMMIGLPLLAFRAPSSIVYERNLDYRPLLTVEVLENSPIHLGRLDGAARRGRVGAGERIDREGARGHGGDAGHLAGRSAEAGVLLAEAATDARVRPEVPGGRGGNTAGAQLLNLGIAGDRRTGGARPLDARVAHRDAAVPAVQRPVAGPYPATAKLLAAGESARTMVEGGIGVAAVATGLILAPATGAPRRSYPPCSVRAGGRSQTCCHCASSRSRRAGRSRCPRPATCMRSATPPPCCAQRRPRR